MTNMQAAFARALHQQSIQPVVETFTPTVAPLDGARQRFIAQWIGTRIGNRGIDGDKRHREEHCRLGARIIALSRTSEDLATDLASLIAGYKPRFQGSAFVLFEIMEYLQHKGRSGESPEINAYCTFVAGCLEQWLGGQTGA